MGKNTSSKGSSTSSKSGKASSPNNQAYLDFYTEMAADLRKDKPGMKGATIRKRVGAAWKKKKAEEAY